MANEITTQEDNINYDAFSKFAQEEGTRSNIVGHLLLFSKGIYVYGQEKEELALGTRMIVNMQEMKRGWVKWEEGKPVRQMMQLLNKDIPLPTRASLGDTDESKWPELNGRPNDPWQLTVTVIMCDQHMQLYTFSTASQGGRSRLAELCGQWVDHCKQRPNEIPAVSLETETYKHSNKQYGRIAVPKFVIVGWGPPPKIFEELAILSNNGDSLPAIEWGGGEEATAATDTPVPVWEEKKPQAQATRHSAKAPTRTKNAPRQAQPADRGKSGTRKPLRF